MPVALSYSYLQEDIKDGRQNVGDKQPPFKTYTSASSVSTSPTIQLFVLNVPEIVGLCCDVSATDSVHGMSNPVRTRSTPIQNLVMHTPNWCRITLTRSEGQLQAA